MRIKLLSLIFIFALFTLGISAVYPFNSNASWIEREIRLISLKAPKIDSTALRYALQAYLTAKSQGIDKSEILTLIDYSKSATEHRLWVLDLKENKVLFDTWTTHGSKSGHYNKANSFSNVFNSHKSSLGVFLTGKTYFGKDGYSLRLNGLEPGFNDHALKRAIVIHGAWYVGKKTITLYHALGHSWGCPAVSKKIVYPLINAIKNGTIVFSYYPDHNYLTHSKFLKGN